MILCHGRGPALSLMRNFTHHHPFSVFFLNKSIQNLLILDFLGDPKNAEYELFCIGAMVMPYTGDWSSWSSKLLVRYVPEQGHTFFPRFRSGVSLSRAFLPMCMGEEFRREKTDARRSSGKTPVIFYLRRILSDAASKIIKEEPARWNLLRKP